MIRCTETPKQPGAVTNLIIPLATIHACTMEGQS